MGRDIKEIVYKIRLHIIVLVSILVFYGIVLLIDSLIMDNETLMGLTFVWYISITFIIPLALSLLIFISSNLFEYQDLLDGIKRIAMLVLMPIVALLGLYFLVTGIMNSMLDNSALGIGFINFAIFYVYNYKTIGSEGIIIQQGSIDTRAYEPERERNDFRGQF